MKKMQKTMVSQNAGPESRHWPMHGLLAGLLGVLLCAGCSSAPKPASNPLAYVEIRGQPHEKVADMAARVFYDNGYQVVRNGWAHLVFEKEGSTMNNIAYSNWMDGPVWVRVKASVVDVSPGTCRLECEAFLLRSRNQPAEEEIRIHKLHSHKYQQLMNEVAKRLNSQPAVPN
jgi:hypothetical protein